MSKGDSTFEDESSNLQAHNESQEAQSEPKNYPTVKDLIMKFRTMESQEAAGANEPKPKPKVSRHKKAKSRALPKSDAKPKLGKATKSTPKLATTTKSSSKKLLSGHGRKPSKASGSKSVKKQASSPRNAISPRKPRSPRHAKTRSTSSNPPVKAVKGVPKDQDKAFEMAKDLVRNVPVSRKASAEFDRMVARARSESADRRAAARQAAPPVMSPRIAEETEPTPLVVEEMKAEDCPTPATPEPATPEPAPTQEQTQPEQEPQQEPAEIETNAPIVEEAAENDATTEGPSLSVSEQTPSDDSDIASPRERRKPPPIPMHIEVQNTEEPAEEATQEEIDKMAQIFASPRAAPESPRTTQDKPEQRAQALAEIFSTERTYVYGLTFLVEHFQQPLNDPKTQATLRVEPADVNSIFSNIGIILNLHKTFLSDLEALSDTDLGGIIKVFQDFVQYFKMYGQYISSYESCLQTLEKLHRNKKFHAWLDAKRNEKDNLGLMAYLIMPVQRIPRYELLFREVLRRTGDNNPHAENLHQLFEKIQEVAGQLNERKRHIENMSTILNIQQRIRHIDWDEVPGESRTTQTFMIPTRRLVRSGTILVKLSDEKFGSLEDMTELSEKEKKVMRSKTIHLVRREKDKEKPKSSKNTLRGFLTLNPKANEAKDREAFIFNDCFMWVSTAGKFKGCISLAGGSVGTFENVDADEEVPSNTFQLKGFDAQRSEVNVRCSCQTEAEMNDWVADLEKSISWSDIARKTKVKARKIQQSNQLRMKRTMHRQNMDALRATLLKAKNKGKDVTDALPMDQVKDQPTEDDADFYNVATTPSAAEKREDADAFFPNEGASHAHAKSQPALVESRRHKFRTAPADVLKHQLDSKYSDIFAGLAAIKQNQQKEPVPDATPEEPAHEAQETS